MIEDEKYKNDSMHKKVFEHWRYIEGVIRNGRPLDTLVCCTLAEYLSTIEYHYRTAMEHGWKHGREEKS